MTIFCPSRFVKKGERKGKKIRKIVIERRLGCFLSVVVVFHEEKNIFFVVVPKSDSSFSECGSNFGLNNRRISHLNKMNITP